MDRIVKTTTLLGTLHLVLGCLHTGQHESVRRGRESKLRSKTMHATHRTNICLYSSVRLAVRPAISYDARPAARTWLQLVTDSTSPFPYRSSRGRLLISKGNLGSCVACSTLVVAGTICLALRVVRVTADTLGQVCLANEVWKSIDVRREIRDSAVRADALCH